MPDITIVLSFLLVFGAMAGIFLSKRYVIQSRLQERLIKELQEKINQQTQESTAHRHELDVILSSMVEGVLVVGRDDKIQYISPNLSDMFDFRSKKVTSKAYWEVIPHGQIVAAIKEVLSTSTSVSKEIALMQQEDMYFNLQIAPVLSEGKVQGAVAVFHDINELKKLLRMRSEFVANVSHELKTPLTSIKGYVETLKDGGLDERATAEKFLDIIAKQTARLEDLVKDLLTLSAIESKEVAMDFKSCDVKVIVQHAVQALKSSSKASEKIAVHAAGQLPQVLGDALRLEQVFINLLENALKFTPEKKSIDVYITHETPYIRVDIKDQGIGIASEHLPRLFERFYRVDKARTTDFGGTGLGLAIVKHIVMAHQGRVEVQSKPAVGSTFTVFLKTV